MAATPATAFSDIMTQLTGNVGGALQALPNVNVNTGRTRGIWSTITLAAQISGTVFGMARIPLFATLTRIMYLSSVSLGATTIALGNAGNANSAIYAAAATFTTANTPSLVGLAATMGAPITSGFDCVSGLATGYTVGGNAGALYEDIIMTTGAASLPGAGTFRIFFEYMID